MKTILRVFARLLWLFARLVPLAMLVNLCLLIVATPVHAQDYTVELDQVRLVDLARLILGDAAKVSYSIDPELIRDDAVFTVKLHRVGQAEIVAYLKTLLKGRGYELHAEDGITTVRRIAVPADAYLVYKPRYRSAKYLADVVSQVAGEKTLASRPVADRSEKTEASAQSSGSSQLTDEPGTVGAQISKSDIDQLAFKCKPDRCAVIRGLLAQIDTPVAQVMLRAVIYEVTTQKNEGSALQVAINLFHKAGGAVVSLTTPNQASGYLASFSSGDINAVISALDSDAHFKSLAKPFLRVLSGAQAKFDVGQQVPVLGAVTLTNTGAPVQSVEYRNSGTIFIITPDVRDDVIDLTVTQEVSAFVPTNTGVNNSPTLEQRKASSRLSVKPGELVMMAGLESAQDTNASSGFLGFRLARSSGAANTELLLFIQAERI